jgi:hypothetical protein
VYVALADEGRSDRDAHATIGLTDECPLSLLVAREPDRVVLPPKV